MVIKGSEHRFIVRKIDAENDISDPNTVEEGTPGKKPTATFDQAAVIHRNAVRESTMVELNFLSCREFNGYSVSGIDDITLSRMAMS